MRTTVVKRLKPVNLAHRLTHGYKGLCENIHGHTYSIDVAVSALRDKVGMVVDFKDVASLCDAWLQTNWDHALVISNTDEALLSFAKKEKQRHFVFPDNTTAENMANLLFLCFRSKLRAHNSKLKLEYVRVWETATAYAEAKQVGRSR